MTYLAKGGSWLTLSQVLSSAASFLLSIAFAHLLPVEEYGFYRYVLSIAAILAIPTLNGMNTALIRAVARGENQSFIPATLTRFKWGALGSLAALALAAWNFFTGSNELAIAFLLCAIFVPVMNAATTFLAFLNGRAEFRLQSVIGTLTTALAALAIFFGLLFHQHVLVILFLYFASNTLLNLFFFALTLKRFPSKTEAIDPNLSGKIKETLSFGKHLSLINSFTLASKQLDKIILWHFLGPAEVALYTFAQIPISQMQNIFSRIASPLTQPKFSRNKLPVLQQTLPGKVLKLFIVFIPFTLLYIFIAPYLYRFLFPEYMSSVAYTQLFALSLLASPISFFTDALVSQKKQKELYYGRISSSVILIAAMIVLGKIYGVWGVVIAQTVFAFWLPLLSFFLFKKAKN
ncbi:MAG TPA: oligosaccharide flippase family protein [Candidatus Paceibacterota bacterium]|nr:oligosaccharide flippase family protein [Candidatus Paceibacterota bacterium]